MLNFHNKVVEVVILTKYDNNFYKCILTFIQKEVFFITFNKKGHKLSE